jgi:hypothetical protein
MINQYPRESHAESFVRSGRIETAAQFAPAPPSLAFCIEFCAIAAQWPPTRTRLAIMVFDLSAFLAFRVVVMHRFTRTR